MKKVKYFIFTFSLFILGGFLVLVQAQTDSTAPSAISDLAVVTTTQSSIDLTWTAPGDDNMTGTSASYDLRYATTTITEGNWASSTKAVNEPIPKTASSTEIMTVSSLKKSTIYYFAVKARDEVNNESGLSNVVSGTTLASTPAPTSTAPTDLTFDMTITPRSLNLNSKGSWVTVHLFLPPSYRVSYLDISTIKLNGSLSPDLKFKGMNYFKKEKEDKGKKSSNLILKFSRSEFIELAGNNRGDFIVTLTGEIDGKTFSANDTIKILSNDLESEETLITATGTPEVYVVKNGRKRHIPSPSAFNRQGLKWNKIKHVSKEEIDSYQDDELLRASDSPAVYLIFAGMKRHIVSPEVFNSYGFDWNDISVINTDELSDYSDASLIRAAGDAKVYLLAGGKRHWIPTLTVFNKHGYKWLSVIIVNSVERDNVPEGENIE